MKTLDASSATGITYKNHTSSAGALGNVDSSVLTDNIFSMMRNWVFVYQQEIPGAGQDVGGLTLGQLTASYYETCRERILQLSGLAPGWDGAGSEPPNAVAIGNALQCLEDLHSQALLPVRINPSSDEGILMEFLRGDRVILIEVFNTGEVAVVEKNAFGERLFDVTMPQFRRLARELVHA